MIRKVWNDYFWWFVGLAILAFMAYGILSDPHGPMSRAYAAELSPTEKLIAQMREFSGVKQGSFSITLPGTIGDVKLSYREPRNGKPLIVIEMDTLVFDKRTDSDGEVWAIPKGLIRVSYAGDLIGKLTEYRVLRKEKKMLKTPRYTPQENQDRYAETIRDLVADFDEILKEKRKERSKDQASIEAGTRRLHFCPSSSTIFA